MDTILVTDTAAIHKLALERIDENLAFRTYLKSMPSSAVDDVFGRMGAQIAPLIDCTACGNCCRHLQAPVLSAEIPILASATGHSEKTFKATFLEKTPAHWHMRHEPCAFLDGNRCSVYDHRPGACRSYPHLTESSIQHRLYGVLDNYAICPIVFNVVEGVKVELGFDVGSPSERSLP